MSAGMVPAFGCFGLVFLLDIAAIVFAAMIIISTNGALERASINLNVIDQIQEDWSTIPFTNFIARNFGSCQPGEEAISWEWPGTVDGCIIRGNSLRTYASWAA